VIEGPPDIIVEILSPGSAKRDLSAKRAVYQAAGVPEYWIVDPESAAIEVLALERGAYVRATLLRSEDILRSRLLAGLEIPLSTIFVDE
jgi:Uma2 family endonuclease